MESTFEINWLSHIVTVAAALIVYCLNQRNRKSDLIEAHKKELIDRLNQKVTTGKSSQLPIPHNSIKKKVEKKTNPQLEEELTTFMTSSVGIEDEHAKKQFEYLVSKIKTL